jgi:hypothetical protein
VDKLGPGPQRQAAADDLTALTRPLDADAGTATGRDASRLQALAATIRLHLESLR